MGESPWSVDAGRQPLGVQTPVGFALAGTTLGVRMKGMIDVATSRRDRGLEHVSSVYALPEAGAVQVNHRAR
jgi:hypothetical protein